ncbi:MAG TPA: hypothetical protein DEA08_36340 [Planctomycetes bacterium]|nr:hypothetical protein [Planctomycetota bacterium]
MRLIEREIDKGPAAQLSFMQGNALFLMNRWPEAEAAFARALALSPQPTLAAWIHANRGYMRGKQADLEGELRDYRRSLELQPKQALAYCYRARTHYVSRRFEEAVADYGRALEHSPRARIHANRGLVYLEMRRPEEARAELARALELDPADRQAKRLKRALAVVERLDWAVERVAKRDFGPQVEAALREAFAAGLAEGGYRLAVLLSLSDRRAEGERVLAEAARMGHRTAAYELYHERLRQGRYEEARGLLKRAVEVGSYAAMVRRGRMHLDRVRPGAPHATEQRELALRYFRLVQARGQPDGLAWIGAVHELDGDLEQAERCYRQAIEEGSGRACTQLAALLRGKGAPQEVRQLLQLARKRGDARALAIQGRTLVRQEDPQQRQLGAKQLRNACFLGGVMAHLRLAEHLGHQGRFKEAIELLERLAEEGWLDGMLALGAMLCNDELALRDLPRGSEWVRRAAELGHPLAKEVLADLLPRLRKSQDPRAAWAAGWSLNEAGARSAAKPLLERAAAGGVQAAKRLLEEAYR